MKWRKLVVNYPFYVVVVLLVCLRWLGYISYQLSVCGFIFVVLCRLLAESYFESKSVWELSKSKFFESLENIKALLKVEKAVHFALVGRSFRSRRVLQTKEQSFSFQKAKNYLTVARGATIFLLVFVPWLHVFIQVGVADAYSIYAHAALLYLNVYGLIWITSDKRALLMCEHKLGSEVLELCLGWRMYAVLPIQSMQSATILTEKADSLRERLRISRAEMTVFSPLDSPNVLIELRSDYPSKGVRIELLERPRETPRFVALYLDDPNAFCAHFRSVSASDITTRLNSGWRGSVSRSVEVSELALSR